MAAQPKPDDPTPMPDMEVIDPIGTQVLIDGIKTDVKRIKLKQLMALLRIMTSAFGENLGAIRLDTSNPEAAVGGMLALLVTAIPVATEEFILFLLTLVSAHDPEQDPELREYIMSDDLDVEVLLEVFEVMATQEQEDMVGLLGKAQAMWARLKPLYQGKQPASTLSGGAGRSRSRST